MKRLAAFILTLFIALFFFVCVDNSNTPNINKVALLPDSEPAAVLLQGDVGFTQTEDNEPSFRENPDGNSSSPQENRDPPDIESISVDIMATNAYVLNATSNFVLYQKNSDEHIAPASTAKMLTALTSLDYCSLDDTITVGSEIELIASDSSIAGLNNGDKLTVRQLLVALLLPSGNDAAYTLAVNAGKKIAGKNNLSAQQAIQAFVDAMNQKATEVGANSSIFKTPDGYDANGQYTTAFDLAQIAKACLENTVLSDIMGSYKIYDTWANGREVVYSSSNELINPNSQYYYSKAIGLKTGSTGDAGSCLVSAADINGQIYICVVMGSSASIRFADSLTVFNAIDPSISLNNTDPAAVPVMQRAR